MLLSVIVKVTESLQATHIITQISYPESLFYYQEWLWSITIFDVTVLLTFLSSIGVYRTVTAYRLTMNVFVSLFSSINCRALLLPKVYVYIKILSFTFTLFYVLCITVMTPSHKSNEYTSRSITEFL